MTINTYQNNHGVVYTPVCSKQKRDYSAAPAEAKSTRPGSSQRYSLIAPSWKLFKSIQSHYGRIALSFRLPGCMNAVIKATVGFLVLLLFIAFCLQWTELPNFLPELPLVYQLPFTLVALAASCPLLMYGEMVVHYSTSIENTVKAAFLWYALSFPGTALGSFSLILLFVSYVGYLFKIGFYYMRQPSHRLSGRLLTAGLTLSVLCFTAVFILPFFVSWYSRKRLVLMCLCLRFAHLQH